MTAPLSKGPQYGLDSTQNVYCDPHDVLLLGWQWVCFIPSQVEL